MKALFFIAWKNMKKKKSDVLVLFFLITLASLLFYSSVSVFFGMDKVLDNAYDLAHTADWFYMNGVENEKVEAVIKQQEEVAEYETAECLYFMEADYWEKGEKETKQTQIFFGKIEEERNISKLVGSEDATIQYNSILLPYYMKSSGGFSKGDIFCVTLGDREYEFQVAGFVEDPLFATPLNINVYGCYISEDFMKDFIEENPEMASAQYVQHKTRLKEGEDSFAFDQKISPLLLQEVPEISAPSNLSIGVNWGSMKGGVAMMSQITMGIVLVFSVLLMLVVFLVMRFSIRNYIEMNLKNVGILQASGYTPGQLNVTVMLEMGMIAVIAVVVGILLGVVGSDLIGTYQGVMLGIQWRQVFHMGAAGLTVVIILGVVFLVSYLGGRIYQKITVLEALRGGIHNHNFKKNYFCFEKSKLPMNIALAGKNMMCEKAKTISIFIIVMILSFSSCVGFALYENFALGTDGLMKMVGIEAGNVIISGEDMDNVGKDVEHWQEVEKVLYYNNGTIEMESEKEKTSSVCDIWDNPELLENEMIIRGRLPKHDNEIVLTAGIAKILKVDTGDTIYVTGQGERMAYVVSGIDQKINNMGLKALMNMEGAKRLNGSCQAMFLYVYTEEGISYEEISEKILDEFPEVSVVDSEKQVREAINTVILAMVVICLLFVAITVFVVALVEIMLVKSKVIRERKNLGLNKAFGFTTVQLIGQTMIMNLPVIALGAIAGAILSVFLMEPLVILCLSFCGIEKYVFTVNFLWMAVTVVGIILVAAVASFVSAYKIRKIEPVKMLAEE